MSSFRVDLCLMIPPAPPLECGHVCAKNFECLLDDGGTCSTPHKQRQITTTASFSLSLSLTELIQYRMLSINTVFSRKTVLYLTLRILTVFKFTEFFVDHNPGCSAYLSSWWFWVVVFERAASWARCWSLRIYSGNWAVRELDFVLSMLFPLIILHESSESFKQLTSSFFYRSSKCWS